MPGDPGHIHISKYSSIGGGGGGCLGGAVFPILANSDILVFFAPKFAPDSTSLIKFDLCDPRSSYA